MAGWTIPEGYELTFYFTLLLLGIKAFFMIYLAHLIILERKKEEKMPLAIFYGGFVMFVTLFISRLSYFIFDFVLTRFNVMEYTYFPNIVFWKVGTFSGAVVGLAILFPVERVILLNKTKSLLSFFLILTAIVQFLYPVRPGNNEDFTLVSSIGTFANLALLLIFIVFFWLGIVSPGLRKLVAVMIASVIIYSVGGLMVSAHIIIVFLPFMSRDVVYAVSISLKLIPLVGFYYVTINFRLINKASMEYYRSKKICIVHRGKVKGKPFMCARCNVLYCTTCKDAIVRVENKCWNCGAVLDASTEISFQIRADDAMFQQFASFKDGAKKETDIDAFRTLLGIGMYVLEQRKNNTLGEHARAIDALVMAQNREEEESAIQDVTTGQRNAMANDEARLMKEGKKF
ncbi:MAG: hypothetical protein Q6370_004055 [Candidatus Sigynarchaeota archaeon]